MNFYKWFWIAYVLYFVGGWTILMTTSAQLLLPDKTVAWDRLQFMLFHWTSWKDLLSHNVIRVKARLAIDFYLAYGASLPLMYSYLWLLDELLYPDYHNVRIVKPIILSSAPRTGTTSFQETLALDDRLVTPRFLELGIPTLCFQKLLFYLYNHDRRNYDRLEWLARTIGRGMGDESHLRHSMPLVGPESEDILIHEFHWNSVLSVRKFPTANQWVKYYLMESSEPNHNPKQRAIQLVHILMQKIMYHHDPYGQKRLLLRSHLTPCLAEYAQQYPDATFIGILREPVNILPSFAGAWNDFVGSANGGVDMWYNSISPRTAWSHALVTILADICQREADLMAPTLVSLSSSEEENHNTKSQSPPVEIVGHYTTFHRFMSDPVQAVATLYNEIGWTMTDQLTAAIHKKLTDHATYKEVRAYKNPTLDELGITEQELISHSGVQKYAALVHAKAKRS